LLPVFEEAAVLYSNGQSNEAAMILWQAIKENQLGQHTEQAWKMLFELYQAAGRRPEFESLAIDYASRFESSPPAWSDDLSPPPSSFPASSTPKRSSRRSGCSVPPSAAGRRRWTSARSWRWMRSARTCCCACWWTSAGTAVRSRSPA